LIQTDKDIRGGGKKSRADFIGVVVAMNDSWISTSKNRKSKTKGKGQKSKRKSGVDRPFGIQSPRHQDPDVDQQSPIRNLTIVSFAFLAP